MLILFAWLAGFLIGIAGTIFLTLYILEHPEEFPSEERKIAQRRERMRLAWFAAHPETKTEWDTPIEGSQ